MKNRSLGLTLILCLIIAVGFSQSSSSIENATIYIGSPTSSLIMAQHFDNNKYIGSSGLKTFIKYECAPGKHLFWSTVFVEKTIKQKEAFLELNVKAGETYYLKSGGTIRNAKTRKILGIKGLLFKKPKELIFNLSLKKLNNNSQELALFKKRVNKKKPKVFSEKTYRKLDKKFNINSLAAKSLKKYNTKNKVVVSNNTNQDVNNNLTILTNTVKKNGAKDYDTMSVADLIKEKNIAASKEDYSLAALLKLKIYKKNLKTKTDTVSIADINPIVFRNNREKIFNTIKKSDYIKPQKRDIAKLINVNPNTGNKKKNKLSKTLSKDNSNILKYRRSSLYTLMIKDDSRKYTDAIVNAFGDAPLLEKFNDQNIGPYLININGAVKDQSANINNYFNTNDVAKKIVAKWFSRNKKGEFSMDLIAHRGAYDASALDVSIAQNTERGMALLADAGEELISNTFVIINDYKFTNKAEVAKKVGGFLKAIKSVAAYVPGAENVVNAASYAQVGVGIVGKGFVIKTTSYLYQLVWNDEVASVFYNDCWVDKDNYDAQKIDNFENSNEFKLKLVGFETAWADIQSTAFSKKSDKDLIKVSTVKATNKAIAKLQRKFEAFRTKTPLLSGSPISAKIGLKEGLAKGDKFEVLEQVLAKNGKTTYKRVGVVKVNKKQIWDNRYTAGEENKSQLKYTTFSGAKNKYFAGMLIRQIN